MSEKLAKQIKTIVYVLPQGVAKPHEDRVAVQISSQKCSEHVQCSSFNGFNDSLNILGCCIIC